MTHERVIQMNTSQGSYDIHIAPNALERSKEYFDQLGSTIVISDEHVYPLYGHLLKSPHRFVIPPGEESKTMDTVMEIVNHMLSCGLGRDTTIIALGGGVVGDVAGFVASIYMRGVPYIQIPTTLVAQVDSSVGGKTAVNTGVGKNTVGTFWQPQKVIIDPTTLRSLPRRDVVSGVAEVVKYGVIYDAGFFQYLDTHMEDILSADIDVLCEVIERCCMIKAEVVDQDEKEHGIRKILNFGHTVGHALESLTHYQEYTHGEAVLVGMILETRLARVLGLIDERCSQEVHSVLRRLGIDESIARHSTAALIEHMTHDKKNRNEQISFILPMGVGDVEEFMFDPEELWGYWNEVAGVGAHKVIKHPALVNRPMRRRSTG